MSLITLFDTIYESHCIILVNFLHLSTVLSVKSFQFQQNKRILKSIFAYFYYSFYGKKMGWG